MNRNLDSDDIEQLEAQFRNDYGGDIPPGRPFPLVSTTFLAEANNLWDHIVQFIQQAEVRTNITPLPIPRKFDPQDAVRVWPDLIMHVRRMKSY